MKIPRTWNSDIRVLLVSLMDSSPAYQQSSCDDRQGDKMCCKESPIV